MPFLGFIDDQTDLSRAILGTYDPALVALSIFIATLGAFAALELSGRISTARRTGDRLAWLATGSVAIGSGVWAMHFIGMLALRLPIRVSHDLLVTVLSMAPAVFAGAIMLHVISAEKRTGPRFVVGGAMMGIGIVLMHHIGMAAVRMDAVMRYDPMLLGASVVIALVLAVAALYVKFRTALAADPDAYLTWAKTGSAAIMGIAVAGMHYTSMAAVHFLPATGQGTLEIPLSTRYLAVLIGLVTIALIGLVNIAAVVGRRLETVQQLEREMAERRRTEQALIESEARLRAIIESFPGAVVIRDLEGRNLVVNRTFGEWYALDRDSIIGTATRDYLPPEIVETTTRQEQDVIRSGETIKAERQVSFQDGVTRDVFSQKYPIFGQDNTIIAVGTTVTDISHIKHMENALKETEERFRAVFDNSPSAILLKDPDGTYLLANRKWHEWFNPEGLVIEGATVHDFYPKDHADMIAALDRRVAETGKGLTSEQNTPLASGQDLPTVLQKFPVFDADGKVVLIGGINTDITDIRNAQNALRESEERFRAIFDSSPSAIALKDFKGRYLMVNNTFTRWMKSTAEEMEGRLVYDFYPRGDAEAGLAYDREVFLTGKIHESEDVRQYRDGVLRTVRTHKSPIHDSNGTIVATSTILTDVTELRRAIEDRREALEAAERASRAKSEFLASVSHELRTPLNAILGFSEVLSGEFFGPLGEARYREYAEAIFSSGNYLLDLVNDILDISRIEAGQYQLTKEPLRMADIFDECRRIAGPRAAKAGVALHFADTDGLAPVTADRRAVKQVLLNLLTNAIKFTPEGGEIGIETSAGGGRHVIRVVDTGIGIAEEHLATLTQPFEKGGVDPYLSQDGVGLGLAICKSLVDLHAGSLDIESTVGQGTAITISLPSGGQ